MSASPFFFISPSIFTPILVTGDFLCAFFFISFSLDMLLYKMLAESGGDKPVQLYISKQKKALHCTSLTCFCVEAGNKQD